MILEFNYLQYILHQGKMKFYSLNNIKITINYTPYQVTETGKNHAIFRALYH